MDAYCRICSRADDFRQFTLGTISQVTDARIDDMLVFCSQLEVNAEDNLPQQICADCLTALNSAFAFRKLCQSSDEAFRDLLRNSESQIIDGDYGGTTGAEQYHDVGSFQEEEEEEEQEVTQDCSIKEEQLVDPAEFVMETFGATDGDSMGNGSDELEVEPLTTSAKSKKKQPMIYLCEECDYTAETKLQFRMHQRRRHPVARSLGSSDPDDGKPKKIFKCEECHYQNYSAFNFKRHQATWSHSQASSYLGVLPRTASQLVKKYFCPHCGNGFKYLSNMKGHLKFSCAALHSEKKNKLKATKQPAAANPSAFNLVQEVQLVQPQPQQQQQQQLPMTTKLREEYQCRECLQVIGSKSAFARHTMNGCQVVLKGELLPFRCDFCFYASSRRSNLNRHQIARCSTGIYMDETIEAKAFLNDTLKRTCSDLSAILQFTLDSGQPIFPPEYVGEPHGNIVTQRPPVELIQSVAEYDFCLVITMLGVRCCACSLFFRDEASLEQHRASDHPRTRRVLDDSVQKCLNCDLPFHRADAFQYHKEVEKVNRLLFCTTCELTLISYTAWTFHCSTHHGRKIPEERYDTIIVGANFRCCNCDSLEPSREALETHYTEVHFPERADEAASDGYECDKCFKRFEAIAHFENHLMVRGAKRFYRCGNKRCQMEFLVEKDVVAHSGVCCGDNDITIIE